MLENPAPPRATIYLSRMIDRELKDITEADLQRLIETPVMESDRIEYKVQITLTLDDSKKKFLASIASFANASGGDLIYGMEADNGRPVALKALANFNPDAESIRIRDLIRTGIAPTVFTAETQAVSLSSGGEVLVIRVRKTWAGAHMVTYGGDNRFYIRHGGARRMMDVTEIRSAFTLSESTIERVQRFRLERLGAILSDDTPCPLAGKAALVFHIVPVRAFDPAFRPNLRAIDKLQTLLRPIAASGWGLRQEFDGVYATEGSRTEDSSGYIFLFRNGALEVVDTGCLNAMGEQRLIPSLSFEEHLFDGLPNWLSALEAVGVEPPVVLMLSLLNAKGYHMAVTPGVRGRGTHAISRDHLHVPGTVLETLSIESKNQDTPLNAFAILRPHVDAVWNACGFWQSNYYDAEGKWTGRSG